MKFAGSHQHMHTYVVEPTMADRIQVNVHEEDFDHFCSEWQKDIHERKIFCEELDAHLKKVEKVCLRPLCACTNIVPLFI